MASAKIKAVIMASKILGAALGFLPTDITAAYPTAALTAEGPIVAINIIIINITFCIILTVYISTIAVSLFSPMIAMPFLIGTLFAPLGPCAWPAFPRSLTIILPALIEFKESA